jgi:Zn-dependent protease
MGIAEIVTIVVLILSIVLHEVAHGYAANWLGDPTARLAGRLTANPLPHIDPIGSIIVPALLFFSSQGIIGKGLILGWAKPVPYNPYNLRNQRWGESFVAFAGPATNFLLAIIFAVLVRLAIPLELSRSFVDLASYVVYINVLLGLFNLIPFPPLDGSKVIEAFLPLRLRMPYHDFAMKIERMGMFALILLLFLFFTILSKPFLVVVVIVTRFLLGF